MLHARDIRRSLAAAALLLITTAGSASAGLGDQQHQASQAPEVPIAAAYPAIGSLTYLVYRLTRGRGPGSGSDQ